MKRLFVDTGAWYAVVDKKDPDHAQAQHFLKNNANPMVTSNFVFDETITLIRSRLGWSVAKDFGERLKKSHLSSITKCNTWESRLRIGILCGYGKEL